MAITIQLLGKEDFLQPTDWIRPLTPILNGFGEDSPINSFNAYGGTPVNHFKWVIASDVIGEVWMGKSLRELEERFEHLGGFNYEVVRGSIPKEHQWDWRKDKPMD